MTVAWTSNDEPTTSGADNDVVYSSSGNGDSWTVPNAEGGQGFISPSDDGYTVNDEDWWIKPIVFNNRLVFSWVSENGPNRDQDSPDTDIAFRTLIDSVLPLDIKIDVGNDGTFDWGPVSVDETEVKTVDIKSALESVMAAASESDWLVDSYGNQYLIINLNVTSEGAGKVRLSNVDIKYALALTTPDMYQRQPPLNYVFLPLYLNS